MYMIIGKVNNRSLLVMGGAYFRFVRTLFGKWRKSNVTFKIYHHSLLDKVMSRNQWHIGVHQRHLMFKGHWRAPHETIYGHKKKVCLDKTFPLGHFMLHFIMFLYTTLQEDQTIRTFAIFQKFLTLKLYCGQWKNVHFQPSSLFQKRFLGNIYVQKFNKIWRSDLHWDIYGSNKDDPDN